MARVMKSTNSSSLAEVVDRILDKGIVIDAWVKVSLVGIELITIEARVVVASVETWSRSTPKPLASQHRRQPQHSLGVPLFPHLSGVSCGWLPTGLRNEWRRSCLV